MTSFGSQLEKHENFGPGFNLTRIVLAYAVLIWHTVAIAENAATKVLQTPLWPLVFAVLPMFFALSGFLVTGSALRLPLREYVLNRSFRIVPALAVDIVICALIIGPTFTVLTWGEYFSSRVFFEYFMNIVGYIHYDLPGVFETNVYPGVVNGALWTVPYEIGCYIIMSGMILVGVIRKPAWVLGSAIGIVACAAVLHLIGLGERGGLLQRVLNFVFFSKGASLIPSFLAGSAIYLLRYSIPYSAGLALLCVSGLLCLGLFADPATYSNPIFIGISSFPLAYLVVWLGLTPLPTPTFLEKGDYSYGVYLYHFPILQSLQAIFAFSNWWTLAVVSILPITLFAMFSWHFIEKPVLKMRRHFSLVGAKLAKEGGDPL